jgi:hypothetical protein
MSLDSSVTIDVISSRVTTPGLVAFPADRAPTRPSRRPAPAGAAKPATPNGRSPPPATSTAPTHRYR